MRILSRVVVGLVLLYYLIVFVVVVGLSRNHTLTREFAFAAAAIVLLAIMSVGLRRAASLRTQRVALVAAALWLLLGAVPMLRTWPPQDVLPWLLLFVLPTALVGAVLRGALLRVAGGSFRQH